VRKGNVREPRIRHVVRDFGIPALDLDAEQRLGHNSYVAEEAGCSDSYAGYNLIVDTRSVDGMVNVGVPDDLGLGAIQ